ncbi:unnamed protein product [Ixodes hexagonus]
MTETGRRTCLFPLPSVQSADRLAELRVLHVERFSGRWQELEARRTWRGIVRIDSTPLPGGVEVAATIRIVVIVVIRFI